ncbi:MAG: DUF4268 domain-containing protein [Chitinophagaceae bacterium]|nr:DUF4268 domain-containing protein [Chitinophagaceae bacterium]
MYSKHEMTRLREQFWTSFGKYMVPVPSAGGHKINWINYKTGVRYIRFLMETDREEAIVEIVLSHPDPYERQQCFDTFVQWKPLFITTVPGQWNWEQESVRGPGKICSRIHIALPGKSIARQQEWPAIITFFKTHIVALDEFWQMVKDGFGD